MLAIKWYGNDDARVTEVPRPAPGPGEVLVRVLATGVCGTDLHVLSHGDWIGKAPASGVTMGHEFVGEVVEMGTDAVFAQKYPHVAAHVEVGTRVCAEPHIPCGNCYWCLRGESNTCVDIGHLGVTRDGSFAEYLTIPAERCSPVPDSVSDLAATGIEPVACAVRALHRSRLAIGETVVVIGAGPMGQHVARLATLSGASAVIVSEPNARRRAIASANGIEHLVDPASEDLVATVRDLTNGIGADVTFEVAGLDATVQQAIDVTRQGGRVVQVGVPTAAVTVDIRKVIIGELEIIGEHATQWDFGTAIDLVARRRVDVDSLVTHTFALDQALEAMAHAGEGGEAVKVVLTPP